MAKKTNKPKAASETAAWIRPYTLMIDNQRFPAYCVVILPARTEPPGSYPWFPVADETAKELKAFLGSNTSDTPVGMVATLPSRRLDPRPPEPRHAS